MSLKPLPSSLPRRSRVGEVARFALELRDRYDQPTTIANNDQSSGGGGGATAAGGGEVGDGGLVAFLEYIEQESPNESNGSASIGETKVCPI